MESPPESSTECSFEEEMAVSDPLTLNEENDKNSTLELSAVEEQLNDLRWFFVEHFNPGACVTWGGTHVVNFT